MLALHHQAQINDRRVAVSDSVSDVFGFIGTGSPGDATDSLRSLFHSRGVLCICVVATEVLGHLETFCHDVIPTARWSAVGRICYERPDIREDGERANTGGKGTPGKSFKLGVATV